MKEYICIPKETYDRLLKVFKELEAVIKDLRAVSSARKKITVIDVDVERYNGT